MPPSPAPSPVRIVTPTRTTGEGWGRSGPASCNSGATAGAMSDGVGDANDNPIASAVKDETLQPLGRTVHLPDPFGPRRHAAEDAVPENQRMHQRGAKMGEERQKQQIGQV